MTNSKSNDDGRMNSLANASPSAPSLKEKLEKLDNQRGAREALAIGVYDEAPPKDEEATLKKLYKIKDWYIGEVEALFASELKEAEIRGARHELNQITWTPETVHHYDKRIAELESGLLRDRGDV